MFIVFEGIDRAGKTSLIKCLTENFLKNFIVFSLAFPSRNTTIGNLLNEFVAGKIKFQHEALHLLFAADRYEHKNFINEKRKNNIVISDRYSWSGIAYANASGIDFELAMSVEKNLPKPDFIFYLNVSPETASKRAGYGEGVLENVPFQSKVIKVFEKLIDISDNVIVLDAEKPFEEVVEIASAKIKELIAEKKE